MGQTTEDATTSTSGKAVNQADASTTTTSSSPLPSTVPQQKRRNSLLEANEEVLNHMVDEEHLSGIFRGIAAATRNLGVVSRKVAAAKAPAAKAVVREIGQARPLAFASEGAVAGESILPRLVYYGAWTLSGIAIASDIYTKQDDAAKINKSWQTVVYWTTFHIPASLVVPAYIIHQIVHKVQHVVDNPKGFAKNWSPPARSFAPVAAALLSIIPVVPVVDTTFEYILEPTLGASLGLEFDHHHGHGHSNEPHKQEGDQKEANS
ncbi:hypothetical protein ACA910_001065 [Epithemia clementina (nom. ined.)]